MKNFEFDFNSSLGDTIMEKYESLYIKLREIGEDAEVGKIKLVIGGPEIVSMFESATLGFSASDVLVQMGDLQYCGIVKAMFGLYGNFRVFKTTALPKNELVIFGEKDSTLLTFTNFEI